MRQQSVAALQLLQFKIGVCKSLASKSATPGRNSGMPIKHSSNAPLSEQLSAESIQQKQGLRENHSTSARVRKKVPQKAFNLWQG
jgi:hypothetical protein